MVTSTHLILGSLGGQKLAAALPSRVHPALDSLVEIGRRVYLYLGHIQLWVLNEMAAKMF